MLNKVALVGYTSFLVYSCTHPAYRFCSILLLAAENIRIHLTITSRWNECPISWLTRLECTQSATCVRWFHSHRLAQALLSRSSQQTSPVVTGQSRQRAGGGGESFPVTQEVGRVIVGQRVASADRIHWRLRFGFHGDASGVELSINPSSPL